MNSARKIQPIVRKSSFAEIEDADNRFWANATEEERFNELADLRLMVYGNDRFARIEKVTRKRS